LDDGMLGDDAIKWAQIGVLMYLDLLSDNIAVWPRISNTQNIF
jgi:hypothetical protein